MNIFLQKKFRKLNKRRHDKKERKWLYVDYEKMLIKLIEIYAEQENVKVEVTIEKVGENKWKEN